MTFDDDFLQGVEESLHANDVAELDRLFTRFPELVNYRFGANTWLHAAAQNGLFDIVELLIRHNCEIDACQKSGKAWFPINSALIANDPRIVRALLAAGADPNHDRLIISAVVGPKPNSLEVVKILESFGADIHRVFENELSNEPMNALSAAQDWGKVDVAEYLMSRGASLPGR